MEIFMLTKSDFIKYTQCCKYLWLYKNRRDDFDDTAGRIFDEGYEVESYACDLFPGGASASDDDIPAAIAKTKELIKSGQKIIYQPTISNWKLFCRSDIIKHNPITGEWDIYEVKSSTEIKDIHLIDLAFQKICFEETGIKIGKLHIIYVNNEYIRRGKIEPSDFLRCIEVTDKVNDSIERVVTDIQSAYKVLENENEPETLILKQCKYPYVCGFKDYCWKHIPEDSIYDIAGSLSREKLELLLNKGILKIKDVPAEMITKQNGLRHLNAVKTEKVFIDTATIKNELSILEYPLYFLDYETFAPAVPLFDGYKPYQRVVFQYSLHIKRSPTVQLEHYEYLSREIKDPTNKLAESLSRVVGQTGSFLAWNKSFEMGCNNEMGERNGQYADFMDSINGRMYDLMQCFKKGYYVHKDFKGSASIKSVMPVLVPNLSYKALNIQEGNTASEGWLKVADSNISQEERNKLAEDMLAYCQLDTLAMVKILEVLNKCS